MERKCISKWKPNTDIFHHLHRILYHSTAWKTLPYVTAVLRSTFTAAAIKCKSHCPMRIDKVLRTRTIDTVPALGMKEEINIVSSLILHLLRLKCRSSRLSYGSGVEQHSAVSLTRQASIMLPPAKQGQLTWPKRSLCQIQVSCWARSHRRVKSLLAVSCPSVYPSIRLYGTTRLSLNGFSWNLIPECFSKICRENSSFITIWHELVLYTKT